MTQSSPLSVDASFQFVDVGNLGTTDSPLKNTPHGVSAAEWLKSPRYKSKFGPHTPVPN